MLVSLVLPNPNFEKFQLKSQSLAYNQVVLVYPLCLAKSSILQVAYMHTSSCATNSSDPYYTTLPHLVLSENRKFRGCYQPYNPHPVAQLEIFIPLG